jgi:hypothetical protein
MKILSIRPGPGGSGARTVAHFDAELSDHCRLYGLLLREFPDGTRRTIAPNNNGRHFATFHPTLGEQLSAAASTALGGLHANVQSR